MLATKQNDFKAIICGKNRLISQDTHYNKY